MTRPEKFLQQGNNRNDKAKLGYKDHGYSKSNSQLYWRNEVGISGPK